MGNELVFAESSTA